MTDIHYSSGSIFLFMVVSKNECICMFDHCFLTFIPWISVMWLCRGTWHVYYIKGVVNIFLCFFVYVGIGDDYSQFFLQRAFSDVRKSLSSKVYSGLLRHLHIYANIYDPGDHFHVTVSWCTLWCYKRNFSGCFQCHSWSIILLFFV